MASFSFLHAADLHLDSPLRGLEADAPAERIRGATRRALENLVALALRERVAFVLLAGDLYDGDWHDYPTGHFLIEQLGRLTNAGIHVYAISGNHDAASVLTRHLPWPPGAFMFRTDGAHSLQVPGLAVMIHGQGFARRAVTDNIARLYPEPVPGLLNIGMLHTACGDTGHDNYAPCSVEQLVGHRYDYWALGHVHARAELNAHPRWVVFPGNTQGRHINEEGAKGATLVRVDGAAMVPEHHALDDVRWARIRVDLAGVDDEGEQDDRVRSALLDAVAASDGRYLAARVALLGTTNGHAGLIRDPDATRAAVRAQALGAGLRDALWIERVEIGTRAPVDRDAGGRSDAVATLMQAIEDAGDAAPAAPGAYARQMLEKVPGLRQALGTGHVAVRAAAGDLPPELLARARDLVLAMLAER